jgi:hypothetical protein
VVFTLVLLAFVGAIVLKKADFTGQRMDSSARALKNQFIAQQLTAIKLNMPVIVAIVYDRRSLTVTRDANGNGIAEPMERIQTTMLGNGARFVIPPVTIDGGAPFYATGPGLAYLNQSYKYPTVTFYPNGSTSGDVVVYLGSASGRPADMRALEITGANSKVRFFRFAGGAWKLAEM